MEEHMKYSRWFVAFAALTLFASQSPAFAEDNGPKALTQEQKDAINKKNAVSGFDISISPEDKQELKEDTAVRACQLIIPKLGVKAACCEDPKCREDVQNNRPVARKYQVKKPKLTFEQQVKKDCLSMGGGKACEDFESARNYVNNRLCLKYGGDDETCQDPVKSREFVMNCRNGACRKPIVEASQPLQKSEPLEEGAPASASMPPPAYPPPPAGISGHEPISIPPPAARARYTNGSNFLGVMILGFGDGSLGPYVHYSLRPVERFSLGLSGGWVHVSNKRLNDVHANALERASFIVEGLIQVTDGKYNLSVGPYWSMIGRMGASRNITAQFVGGEAQFKVNQVLSGEAFLKFYLGGNLGPKNGIMEPGSTVAFALGWMY
jgi:hypothetical protein